MVLVYDRIIFFCRHIIRSTICLNLFHWACSLEVSTSTILTLKLFLNIHSPSEAFFQTKGKVFKNVITALKNTSYMPREAETRLRQSVARNLSILKSSEGSNICGGVKFSLHRSVMCSVTIFASAFDGPWVERSEQEAWLAGGWG